MVYISIAPASLREHVPNPHLVNMPIRIVRLGTPRIPNEGTRLGTVRRPPRGVRREQFATRDYYDVWVPDLAASGPVVSWALSEPWTDARWTKYTKLYLREMAKPVPRRLIAMLAAMSATSNFSVGCYCADETRCHRTLLRQLLVDAGAVMVAESDDAAPTIEQRAEQRVAPHARKHRSRE